MWGWGTRRTVALALAVAIGAAAVMFNSRIVSHASGCAAPALSEQSGAAQAWNPQAIGTGGTIGLFVDRPLRWERWREEDLRHVAVLAGRATTVRGSSKEAASQQLRREQEELTCAIRWLVASGGSRDPERGFVVYDTEATGRLAVLADGLERRRELERAITWGWTSLVPGVTRSLQAADYGPMQLGGYLLEPTSPDRYPDAERVARALSEMQVPDPLLEGYRVFLLPYSMGAAAALSGPGYAVVGGVPERETWAPNYDAVAVSHEVGHEVQYGYLGQLWESPLSWLRYMRLRGVWGLSIAARADSDAWERSPEEALAEDVRVLFGAPEVQEYPYMAAAPPLREASGKSGPGSGPLARFLLDLMEEDEQPPPVTWVPRNGRAEQVAAGWEGADRVGAGRAPGELSPWLP